jgi:hypothetical protein
MEHAGVGLSRSGHDMAVRRSRSRMKLLAPSGALAFSLLAPKDASACGACYASNNESTVVSDHRMALAISKQRTILWDQIQYTGNPKDFAYVLPAKPGTTLEPSTDAWFTALDATTRPIIMPPPSPYSGGGGDDSVGCCVTSQDSFMAASRGASPNDNGVQVLAQAVVGPYDTVTLRSTDPDALRKWLADHNYAIPEISGPIIAQYVANGFDFIALRMRPSQAERQIEPIRIVSPGPDPSLPLRLMQIGSGPKIGITLYVISEGRYHGKNFPDGTIDLTRLVWDVGQNRSNYQELSQAAMAANDGRSFLTEYAKKPDLSSNGGASPVPSAGGNMTGNPPLGAAYAQACSRQKQPAPTDPLPQEKLDASTDDASDEDAGLDASADDAGIFRHRTHG